MFEFITNLFTKKPIDQFVAELKKTSFRYKVNKKDNEVEVNLSGDNFSNFKVIYKFNKDYNFVTIWAWGLKSYSTSKELYTAYETCNKLNNDSMILKYELDFEHANEGEVDLDSEYVFYYKKGSKEIGEVAFEALYGVLTDLDDAVKIINGK